MLYTSVTAPQVLVTVDDIQAACANADCDYEYVSNSAEVTSQDVTDLAVTIGGTGLSTTDTTIIFGGATCGTITGDDTSRSCTLSHLPYGGSHNVEYYDSNGLVTSSGLTEISVDMSITSVSPTSDLNQNGGDVLTIAGNGFPNVASYVTVEFADGTFCSVDSSTPT